MLWTPSPPHPKRAPCVRPTLTLCPPVWRVLQADAFWKSRFETLEKDHQALLHRSSTLKSELQFAQEKIVLETARLRDDLRDALAEVKVSRCYLIFNLYSPTVITAHFQNPMTNVVPLPGPSSTCKCAGCAVPASSHGVSVCWWPLG